MGELTMNAVTSLCKSQRMLPSIFPPGCQQLHTAFIPDPLEEEAGGLCVCKKRWSCHSCPGLGNLVLWFLMKLKHEPGLRNWARSMLTD